MDSNNYTEYHRALDKKSKSLFGVNYEDISYDKKLEVIESVRKDLRK